AAELRLRGQSVPAKLRTSIDAELEEALADIRRHGVSRIVGGAVPGVSALAAPVLDEAGAMVMTFTAIGPTASFDAPPDGAVAQGLKRAAAEVSGRLGAPPACA